MSPGSDSLSGRPVAAAASTDSTDSAAPAPARRFCGCLVSCGTHLSEATEIPVRGEGLVQLRYELCSGCGTPLHLAETVIPGSKQEQPQQPRPAINMPYYILDTEGADLEVWPGLGIIRTVPETLGALPEAPPTTL